MALYFSCSETSSSSSLSTLGRKRLWNALKRELYLLLQFLNRLLGELGPSLRLLQLGAQSLDLLLVGLLPLVRLLLSHLKNIESADKQLSSSKRPRETWGWWPQPSTPPPARGSWSHPRRRAPPPSPARTRRWPASSQPGRITLKSNEWKYLIPEDTSKKNKLQKRCWRKSRNIFLIPETSAFRCS